MTLFKRMARRLRLTADAGMSTAEYAVGTVAAQVDEEGESITLDVSGAFDDANPADVLTYSAVGLPPGLAIDPAAGSRYCQQLSNPHF